MSQKKGRQKPTKSVVLESYESYAPEAKGLYEESGRTLLPWQYGLLMDIMGYGRDKLWTHIKFGYSVPRRNGKSEVVLVRELWGIAHGERICHTAHRTSTSHDAWVKMCKLLSDIGYFELGRARKDEPRHEKSFKPTKQYGLESIKLTGGGEITFRTRTVNGGLGEGFDLLVIDEAQEYTDAQESALKYTVTDSPNPQTILCGTPPTAVSVGTVFPKMRRDALEGRLFDAGWAEWSIGNMTHDLYDAAAWYETNPSLGYHLTERNIRGEIGGDELDHNVQRLGFWADYELKSAISKADWEAVKIKSKPKLEGRLYVGVKFSNDGGSAALSIASMCADGRVFVECLGCEDARKGVGWMAELLKKLDFEEAAADGANGQELLKIAMKNAHLPSPIFPKVKEIIAAYASFEQAVYSKSLCHAGQEGLEEIATACGKRQIGSSGGWGYKALKEGGEIAVLDSAVIAHWLCRQGANKKKQKISY